MKQIQYRGYSIKIQPDSEPESPRSWDNLGTIIHWHPRYELGDKRYNRNDFNGPDGSLLAELGPNLEKTALFLPVYLYDHSGLSVNTTGFSCPWDSGQVGWIYVTREKIITEGLEGRSDDEIKAMLRGEIETFDHYVSGEVYGYQIVDEDDNDLDSCWGYFGDPEKSGLLDEARANIDYCVTANGKLTIDQVNSLSPVEVY